MSQADPDDIYASDEYEPESPAHSPLSSTHLRQSLDSSTAPQTLQPNATISDDNERNSKAVTQLPQTNSKQTRSFRESDSVTSRRVLDNAPWTYIVSALKVRMLRIPVADSVAIRELRVFARIGKHAAQSQGSKWKPELLSVKGGLPLKSTKKQKYRSKSLRRVQPYRRSGFIEEAKWVRHGGQLQWTFPVEKFRHYKAYTPRVKAFVYGIRETGSLKNPLPQIVTLVRQEQEEQILSFGWFFLDLRTPDLPERWLKLQNSPFGGEILISSTFLPVQLLLPKQPAQPADNLMARFGDEVSASVQHDTETLTVSRAKVLPAVVLSESGGYLQIGDGSGQDIFVLSVFIQAAFNLSKVVESAIGENQQKSERTGFWLSYSLFDVVVQTDIFFNLSVAEFSPIRDSFRIKTSAKDFAHCVEALKCLTVFLCAENRVLAGVMIPLTLLLTKGLFAKPGIEENKLKLGNKSNINGKFSFPDFDDAFISASVTVELNETITTIDEHQHYCPTENEAGINPQEHMTMKDDDEANSSENPENSVTFKLEYLRFEGSVFLLLTDKENVSIELIVGDKKAVGILEFCSYNNKQAFATCQALNVENVLLRNAHATATHVRCFSSVSNTFIAESLEAATIVSDDKGNPRSIEFQLQSETKQVVGQCTLSCTRGPQSHQKINSDLFCDASEEKHLYRLCLQLKSIRDFHMSGEYSLRYLNPFLNSVLVTSDCFTVKDTNGLLNIDFYCMFDLIKNRLELKEVMQESVIIDLISSDEEIIGSAVFSLSYLYFSEEHYCCSKENCEEVFRDRTETEAHWLEVHSETALVDAQAGSNADWHSYRSCSINIPIVHDKNSDGSTGQQSLRLGSIHVSACLEDTGLLTGKRASAQNAVPGLSGLSLQDKVQANSRLVEAGSSRSKQEDMTSASVVLDTQESSRSTPASKRCPTVEVAVSKSGLDTQDVRQHEQENKSAQLREVLEREKRAWGHEQQLEQLQWKRRFAELEKARMDELEEEWAHREEERSNLLKSAQKEYQQLEQALRKALVDLELRERRLAVAEAALQREQEVKRDENESLKRRLTSEQSHTLALAKKQTEAYERRIALLESQLCDGERRAKEVEADFAEYRRQQRKVPESKLREEIAALRGNVSELERQTLLKERECEVAAANVEKMKAQLDQMAGLLTREKKMHEARVVDELEKLRVKYLAREEKYVLDGDREELRAIKQQLDDLKGFKLRGNNKKIYSHKQRPHENYRSQRRQTGIAHQVCSSSESNCSFQFDHAESNDDTIYVPSRRSGTFCQSETHGLRCEQIKSSSRSSVSHTGSTATKIVDQVILPSFEDTSQAQSGSELGRLLRERHSLLASGTYDTQSYLVRELDRLISLTKANSEHK